MVAAVIEMAGDGAGYGVVHLAGCRDVRDPLPLGAVACDLSPGENDLGVIVAECTGWDCDEKYEALAPCFRDAHKRPEIWL